MCKTDKPRSVNIFLVALPSYSCLVKSMYFSQISLLFLTESHSRDAVHDIAGMLLGILKRLRTSCGRIAWKEKLSMNCQSVLSPLLISLTFLLEICWGKYGAFTCHLKFLI